MDLFKSVAHPGELVSLLKFKYGGGKEMVMPSMRTSDLSPNLKKCYLFLQQTSRSFAAVIQALDQPLRDAICIFYLVLRALDTIEDDMTIPLDEKVSLLRSFHSRLYEVDWKYMNSREKDRQVLEEFPIISEEFRNLDSLYQEIIADIAQSMGSGVCACVCVCVHACLSACVCVCMFVCIIHEYMHVLLHIISYILCTYLKISFLSNICLIYIQYLSVLR